LTQNALGPSIWIFARWSLAEIKNRTKRLPLHLALEVKGEDATGVPFREQTRCKNVSGGGLLFESGQKLLVGSRVHLAIRIPAALREHFGGHEIYETAAVICRLEKMENDTLVRVGARFVSTERERPGAKR
jgi:hypothetical protein